MPFQFDTYEPRYTGSIAELMSAPARAKARAAQVRGQANAESFNAVGNAAAGTIGAIMDNRATAPARAMQARAMQLELQTKERAAALEDQAGAAAKDFAGWVQASGDTLPTPAQVIGRYGPELGPRFVNVLKTIHPDAEPMVVNPGDTVIDKRNPGAAPLYTAPAKPDLMEVGGTVIDKNQPGAGPVYTAPEKAPTAGSFEDYVRRGAQEQGKTVADLKPADIEGFRKKYQQADDRPTTVNINGAAGGLDPDAVDYTATQYRILGPSGIPTRIEGPDRVKILNAAAKQAKALGQSPAQAVQKQAAFKADASSLTKMQTMASAAEAFETKAIAQADLVSSLSGKVGRTQFPIVNGVLLSGKEYVGGDENTHLFSNALLTFTTEYAKLMEGSTGSSAGSSEGARRDAAKLISTALNNGTIQKTLAQMKWEMRQTRTGYDATIAHITDRMGGAPTTPPAAAPPAAASGVSVTAPNGQTFQFKSQADADAFKAKAGIQ